MNGTFTLSGGLFLRHLHIISILELILKITIRCKQRFPSWALAASLAVTEAILVSFFSSA